MMTSEARGQQHPADSGWAADQVIPCPRWQGLVGVPAVLVGCRELQRVPGQPADGPFGGGCELAGVGKVLAAQYE
jgi:hypothetical protein